MRPRYFFNIFTSITIFAFVPLLSVAGCIPPDKANQPDTASAAQVEVQDAVVGRVDVGFDASALNSAAPEPISSPATAAQDGPSLLASHCSQCHSVQQLIQFKKSHSEWSKALDQMQAMGVRLSDTEKDVLLDYLSVVDK